MAKLIYSVIASLDGYIEDPRQVRLGAPDEEVHALRQRPRAGGRHLPVRAADVRDDGLLGDDADLAEQSAVIQDYAEIWQAADKIVYSRTLETATSAQDRIEREFDPEAVRQAQGAADRDLTVGGPELAAQAIEAGLVDEYQLFLVPVVIGGGKQRFPTASASTWSCWTSGASRSGIVYLRYRAA